MWMDSRVVGRGAAGLLRSLGRDPFRRTVDPAAAARGPDAPKGSEASQPPQRPEPPQAPEQPVEALVTENRRCGVTPDGWTASALWKRPEDIPDDVYFRALEALG